MNITMQREKLYSLDYLHETFNGEVEEVLDMIDMYIGLVPSSVEKMREALSDGNTKEVKRLAHKLKTTFMLFDSKEALELARALDEQPGTLEQMVDEVLRLDEIVSLTVKDLEIEKKRMQKNG